MSSHRLRLGARKIFRHVQQRSSWASKSVSAENHRPVYQNSVFLHLSIHTTRGGDGEIEKPDRKQVQKGVCHYAHSRWMVDSNECPLGKFLSVCTQTCKVNIFQVLSSIFRTRGSACLSFFWKGSVGDRDGRNERISKSWRRTAGHSRHCQFLYVWKVQDKR